MLFPPCGSRLESKKFQITMTEIPNSKPLHHLKVKELQTCFGHWIFEFVIYLRFGAWSLGFQKPSYSKRARTSNDKAMER
jgi:hypothetical protein